MIKTTAPRALARPSATRTPARPARTMCPAPPAGGLRTPLGGPEPLDRDVEEKVAATLENLRRLPPAERRALVTTMPIDLRRRLFDGRDGSEVSVDHVARRLPWRTLGRHAPKAEVALALAVLCERTYRAFDARGALASGDTLFELLRAAGWSVAPFGEGRPPRGLVLTRDDELWLVLRGTQGGADVIADLDLGPERDGRGHVHRGFAREAARLAPELARHVARHPDARVTLAGHSLGGALAVLLARELAHRTPEAIYTFGAPRVFDACAADDFDARLGARTYRFEQRRDVVPTVPEDVFGTRFQAVGRCLFLSDEAELVAEPHPEEVTHLRGAPLSAHELWMHGLGAAPVQDHSIRGYVKSLYVATRPEPDTRPAR